MLPFAYSNISNAYLNLDLLDSTKFYLEIGDSLTSRHGWKMSPLGSDLHIMSGKLFIKLGDYQKALSHFQEAIRIGDYLNLAVAQYHQADVFFQLKQYDSSFYYAQQAYRNGKSSKQMNRILDASRLLTKLYSRQGLTDSAYYFQSVTLDLRDSLYSPQNFKKLQLNAVKEQQAQYEALRKKEQAEQDRMALVNNIRLYSLTAALAVFSLIALILYRNNNQKQKANKRLETALTELKSTQTQLIHAEKMASLGELTAGIAHEIQNPLNFVNNFSEVSLELVDELKAENARLKALGVYTEADDTLINLSGNLEKTVFHGKRADAIVKSMLQHSRTSTGKKEPTDINALCDEYLRLAYHGYRAKDKSFNASFTLNADEKLPLIQVLPQDIGRVMLNLINNAFYAVDKKAKSGVADYRPEVMVHTKQVGNEVQIQVKDNGPGIPDSARDKIFQPFFTTKPTGEGTGLGLSMAYDIIKVHGGELVVESRENEGTMFIIKLINK
jgi:signal transduction histidine kinase